jgi:small subunit ribosomal protein S1
MPENSCYLPEGLRPQAAHTPASLRAAMEAHTILEGACLRCSAERALTVSLGSLTGVIPREEAVAPWINGSERDIALLSRVGRPVCFCVTAVDADAKGAPVITLSRRAAQEAARGWMLQTLRSGDVVTAVVTHLAPFGAFLDIGCGVIAMLPIERISVSRIAHPNQRFQVGQKILAAVSSIDPSLCRFTMTHRELLGSWLDNASRFSAGETVPGIVRSIKDYGCFIELAPNLSGLADNRDGIAEGDRVSVHIRSIRPESMKIKLQIIDRLPPQNLPEKLRYQVTDGHLDRWLYSPPGYLRPPVETVFTSDP